MFSFCFHSAWKNACDLSNWCHITVHNFIWFLHYSFKKFGQPTLLGSSHEQQCWFCPPHPEFHSERDHFELVPSGKNCGARTPNWPCTVNFRDTTSLLNTLCFLILVDIRMSKHPNTRSMLQVSLYILIHIAYFLWTQSSPVSKSVGC